ncbi:MAG TPA: M48 family metallopeptidase [Albidovulum sp.]|uniref:M48 family metallopeptidase n=1 Tax=Albidovulum sp. TaxID=1872424 RepID=UPI002B6C8F49|nr:M48 family metallopeptidase [Albidovulum sp.]
MKSKAVLAAALGLSGCISTAPYAPAPLPAPMPAEQPYASGPAMSPDQAVNTFIAVRNRIEPVVERACRERGAAQNCDFQIGVADDPNLPPNAFQTLDKAGRPVIAFTVALIADARNADEIAFVMGHEAAHHIAGHIPRQQANAQMGAVLGAALGAALGSDQSVQMGQQIGGSYGARRYAKDYELEADALGTELTVMAGYNPERGAAFFTRIPDPGNAFLGTHPPNAQRLATVRATLAWMGWVAPS